MKQIFKINQYCNKLNKEDFERVYQYLMQNSLKQKTENKCFVFWVNKNVVVKLYETQTIFIYGKNVVNIVKELQLPYLKFIKTIEATINNENIIGCDEVGFGDYFGGVVSACVYTDPNIENQLRNLGVQDSKKLNDSEIKKLAVKIMQLTKYEYCVLTPKIFNYLNEDKGYNMNIIKTYIHNTCISNLKNKLKKDAKVVMDQYCDEKQYIKYLELIGVEYSNHNRIDVFTTKAESKYIAVAAASIIARYCFLDEIKQLEKELKKYNNNNEISIQLGAVNKKLISEQVNLIPVDLQHEFIKKNFKW